jgi:anthranilate synthase/aminodeoxychorismate synthase-like glutamine amidotransferase
VPMHGKPARIHHAGTGLFSGLPNPFIATRYHSLVIAPASIPSSLVVTATSEDGEIMAVQHVEHPVYGVQFHPESVLTEHGYRLLDHFLHGVPAVPRRIPDTADGALARPSAEATPLAAAPPPAHLVR